MKRIRIQKHTWLQLEKQSWLRFIILIQNGRIELGFYYNFILDWRI